MALVALGDEDGADVRFEEFDAFCGRRRALGVDRSRESKEQAQHEVRQRGSDVGHKCGHGCGDTFRLGYWAAYWADGDRVGDVLGGMRNCLWMGIQAGGFTRLASSASPVGGRLLSNRESSISHLLF